MGKAEGIDELIEKAKHINFDAYNHINLRGYHRTMREMVEYFQKNTIKKLNEYKPLDLGEIEKRIAEKEVYNRQKSRWASLCYD